MINGKVKYFNVDKGYGFITRDDGDADTFFHLSGMIDRYAEIRVGDRVSFEMETDARSGRLRAGQVEVVA